MLRFFALTFLAAWTCFFAAGALPPDAGMLRSALFLLGTIAPSMTAVGLAARTSGREGVLALLRPIARWNVGGRWYVFALGFMAAVKLAAATLHRLMLGEWPQFGEETWFVMAAAIVLFTWVQAGEEIGWRGYALPRMAARFGLGPASLILGLVWALWHLPLFLIPGTGSSGQSFPLYALQVTALSVAMAWLYLRTGCSLLLVMLFHSAVNNTKDIVPSAVGGATNPFALSSSPLAWLTAGLLWLAAAYFLFSMRNAALPASEDRRT